MYGSPLRVIKLLRLLTSFLSRRRAWEGPGPLFLSPGASDLCLAGFFGVVLNILLVFEAPTTIIDVFGKLVLIKPRCKRAEIYRAYPDRREFKTEVRLVVFIKRGDELFLIAVP